jgi:hypothetical protein
LTRSFARWTNQQPEIIIEGRPEIWNSVGILGRMPLIESVQAKGIEMKKELSPKQRNELLAALKARFDANKARHPGLVWAKVPARLEAKPDKLWSLAEMERTGGEPDVVGHDKKSGECIFFDCSEQTPAGRVSLCYDDEALASRKEHKPKGSAVGMAAAMGIELLTEEQYLDLQKLGELYAKA